jgi:hypothetical protein
MDTNCHTSENFSFADCFKKENLIKHEIQNGIITASFAVLPVIKMLVKTYQNLWLQTA